MPRSSRGPWRNKQILISHNHGYYCLGRTRGRGLFPRLLTCARPARCRSRSLSLGGRAPLIDPQSVARFQDQMYASEHYNYDGSTEWAALLRKLDREQPDYKT